MRSTEKCCVFKYDKGDRASLSSSRLTMAICFSAIVFVWVVARPLYAHANHRALSTTIADQPVDPNKEPSELNHHVAGWALIGVGLLALTSLVSPRFKSQRYVWPALFVVAGLYLALWSDGEIWPRGNLSWSWLLEHDREARQHKIYSVLLIAIGILEYARIRGSLPRFWKICAFPMLAVIGASMLLIHDHGSGSGARSPEAQAYLVNPALDVDGSERQPSLLRTSADGAKNQHPMMHHSSGSGMDASVMDGSMAMTDSQMAMDSTSAAPGHTSHHHLMTASMILIEREHMWFLIVGLAIGLFKFISDSELFRSRIVPYMWPSCMVLLGVLLVFYRE